MGQTVYQTTALGAVAMTVPGVLAGPGTVALETDNLLPPLSLCVFKTHSVLCTHHQQSKFQTAEAMNNIFSVIEMNFRLKNLTLIIPSSTIF